ncbi:uncharacterized protein [Ranitomeya imitator]|uniref:uncharacterized protein isoform X6 n=1 Tax=Ranitomeya imitator TaxID=111125 RepID=UPI0037E8E5CB
MICLALLRMYHRKMFRLCLLLFLYLHFGELQNCDEKLECQSISIKISNSQITVTGLSAGFFLQKITDIDGNVIRASDNSLNNTSLMSLSSGTQYVIYYGDESTSCCHKVTASLPISSIENNPSALHSAMNVEFSPFHASYGDIVAYAVVVTTHMTDDHPPQGILSKTYDDFKNKLTNTYVTYILGEEQIASFVLSKKIGVRVGDGTKTHSYYNGPLDPQLQYRVSIAGFNIIQYDLTTDTIIEDQSLLSFTDYMGPYSLITETNIKGLPDSNVQTDASGGAIFVEFSPFHASYGDIVAYAVVVTTEMTDDRPPDGILSKTYDDFKNKLTNTYVTYILEEESIMSFAQSKKIGVHVGDGTKTHSYFNGPLDPQLQYRVSIAGFNIIQYDLSTDIIIEDQSLLSFTDYMGPYSIITETNIKGLPDSNIQTDPSGGGISVEFSPFHASYGDIVAYAVVVTTEMTDDRPPDGILSKTYDDFKNKLTNTYVTYILEEESIMSFAQSKKIGVRVGDGTKTHSYFNGPLDPQLQYRVSIAGFNIIQYDLSTDTIIEDQSLLSFTDYMGPYSVITETNIKGLPDSNIQTDPSGGAISVEFSPFHASYGDIVAYAVVVTTEMTDDRPPDGILSKTYDDFKNKLTNIYVTYILEEESIMSFAQSKKIGVRVGDGTKTHSYFNGPLDPQLQYRVSIAGFNIIQYDLTTDTIIEDQSMVSFTDYMGPYSLTTETSLTSFNTISKIGSVESTYTGSQPNEHGVISVEFSPFHASYGDIVAYAAVVTTEMNADQPPQGILSKTYDDFKNKLTDTYVTSILGEELIARFAQSKKIGVHVGDGTKTHSYFNGPLDPELQYRVSIAGFNNIKYDTNTDTINEEQSIVSFTSYMDPSSVLTRKTINSVNEISRLDYVEPSFTGLTENIVFSQSELGDTIDVTFSPLDNSNGPVVAYAVIVTTEMTEDHPPQGILSKTYEDFQNKVTDTYVTYIFEKEQIVSSGQSNMINVLVGDGSKSHSYFNGPLDPELQYRVSIAEFNNIKYDTNTDTINEEQSIVSFTSYMDPSSVLTRKTINSVNEISRLDYVEPSFSGLTENSLVLSRSELGDTIDVTFSPLDNSNGPVVAYAVVVTTEMTDDRPHEGILSKTYEDFQNKLTDTYVTYILEKEQIVSSGQSNMISVLVGDGSKSHSYFNGPLDPELQYRVSIAGFNNIKYDTNTDTINEEQSTVSFTSYMDPSSVLTRKTINSVNEISRINYVEPSFTGLTENNIVLSQSELGNSIDVTFSPVDNSNGPVVAYAVVVTTEMTDDRPPQGILSKTYDDFQNKLTDTYVTYILEKEQIVSSAESNMISVLVGDGSKSHSYFNGPLDPELQYRVSIAEFNNIKYDTNTDTINEEKSMVSFTSYMDPSSVLTRKNINSVNEISRIDYVKPSFTGLTKNNIVLSQSELGNSIDVTFSPLDNSNGPVVAYAVIVTTEMTDDHPRKGILSKTYNDFQNKLTDTYVTYILEKEQIVSSGQSNMISVLVGDGSKSHSYFNGPLDPELQYRVSIAEFNNIKYDTNTDTDTINEEKSMVSFTSYMDPSSVLTRKNINSVNEISRIDYVKPSFTGLTENNIVLSQSELGNSIDVTFSPLDNSNGPVVAYAVIVTTEMTDDHPRKGILSKTYNDFQNKLTDTYVTYILEKEQIVSSGQSKMISVLVGDGSKSHSYFNGPLDPELQYRVSIASFNNIKYNRNKDTINEKQSMVSFTNYMDPSSVLSRSNINSLNAISRIGAMEPPYTELLDNIVISPSEHSGSVDVTFSPFISSNEPIVAYAAIITTEMNDNRPNWGVLSKTYNDFKNNLTDTYVTYIFEQEPIMSSEKSNTLSVIVGDKSKTHSYFNGPLDPKLQYRVCIAGFNEIRYDPNTDIINEEQSLASFTSYMGPFSVPTTTNNTSLNKVSTIGNEKTSYTGIIVGAVVVFVAAVVLAAIGLRRKKSVPSILKINNAGEEERLNCELKELSCKSPVLLSQAKAEPSKISTSKKSRERKGDHHKNENGNTEEEERLNSEPEQLNCETEFQDKPTKIPTNMKSKESWGLNCELEEISCVREIQEDPKNISTNVISKEGRGDQAKFYNSDYCHLMRLNCDLEQIICERGIQEETTKISNMKSKESFGLNSQLKQISYEKEFQKEPTKISTDMISKENWGLNSKLEQITCKKGIQEDSEISTILKSMESFGPNYKLEQVSSERGFQGEPTQISTDIKSKERLGLNSKLEQISCKKGIQEESTEVSTIMKSKESSGPDCKLEQVSSERGFQGESTQISTDMKWGLNSKLEQISCKKGIQEESTEISTIMKSNESSVLNCKLEQVSSERGFQGESTQISTNMKSKERLGLNCELEQVSCERGIQQMTKSSTYMKPKENQGLNCNLNQLSGETRFQEESTNISTNMKSKESYGLNHEVDQLSSVTRFQEELTTFSTNMSRLNCEQISCERGIQEESTKISTNLKSMESQGLNCELIQRSGEARFQQASTMISSNMISKDSWGLRFMESEKNYEALFKNLLANNCSGFNMEYDTLKSVGIVQSRSVAVHAANKEKNRQDAAYPYDISRVTLLTLENSSDGYINASYIPGYRSEREFIAAQHPLPGTMKDFWYMIWEQRVNTIVMLSSKQENYQGKGEEYWPKPEAKTFGCIIVTFMHEHIYNSWTTRDFMVTNLKDCTSHRVRQFHFTEWHQSGKMDDREVLMQFVHEVRQYKKDISSNCPTVVHCRTGTGRSGIFIALDCIINQLECDKKVDVCGTVHKMHLHRPLMVQTADQYIFLHCCTLDIIRDKKKVNTDDQKVTEDRSEDAILHTVYHSHTLIESTQGQPSLP